MSADKHPIHTTLCTDAMRVLERYEKEMGAKNIVLERALLGMDKLRFKEKTDPRDISRIIKRVKIGIPGVDELLEGGIPEGLITAITGSPGTGKTTFTLQFLMEGLKNNEKCIYFSFEEKVDQLAKQAIRFGWNLGEYIDKTYLEVFGSIMLSTEEIVEILEIFKPKRIVFDSLNALFDLKDFRKSSQWRSIKKKLNDNKITSMVITEKRHGLEVREFDDFDFMADGIIFLDKKITDEAESYGKSNHFLQVWKMRLTKTDETLHSLIFSSEGLKLNREEKAKKVIEKKVYQKKEEPKPVFEQQQENKEYNEVFSPELLAAMNG